MSLFPFGLIKAGKHAGSKPKNQDKLKRNRRRKNKIASKTRKKRK